MNTLEWISSWFSQRCDGEWEHTYGLTIETLDNPGWNVAIDLAGTKAELSCKEWFFLEHSDVDWYGFKVEDGKFIASGDPSKLEFLLLLFKEYILASEVNVSTET